MTHAVTKAVLLAAGRGTRLGALTESTPKPLLEVAGAPIIAHILVGLRGAGIRDVLIVTGYLGDQIERQLGDGSSLGLRLTYRRQEAQDGTARAVSLAREFVGSERFFAGWGDILVDSNNYARLLEASDQADGALAINEVDDPTDGAAVYVDEQMRATRIIEKPVRGTSTTRWNNAGLFVLPPEIWSHIGALKSSDRGEYELPQAIAAFVDAGGNLRGVPVQGPWFDLGTPRDLEAARSAYGTNVSGRPRSLDP